MSHPSEVQDRINEYWTLRAPAYDAYQLRPERFEVDQAVWAQVWSDALPTAPAEVLDVGTGSGYVALLLARLGHRVTGIDLAEGMLECARAHVDDLEPAEFPAGPPAFELGDAVTPPFPDASFDAVVGRYVAWTLRDAKDALAHWHRLLRPGGTLALVDSTWYPNGIGGEGGNDSELIAGYYDHDVRAALPLHDAASIQATAELVAAAGYTDVTVTPLEALLELDRAHGVAPHHEVQMQYLVRAVRA